MLRGRLEDFALIDIMRLISNAGESGVLNVRTPAGRGRIVFAEGAIEFAESPRSLGFGRDLVGMGSLTEDQLARLIERCAGTGEALEDVLADTGWVGLEKLREALRRELENAFFDILSWRQGDFDFEMGLHPVRNLRLAVDVGEIAARAGDVKDDYGLQAGVPVRSFRAISGEMESNVVLSGDEWRFVAAIDGRATVAEVARRAGLARDGLREMLEDLVSKGLIELAPPEEVRIIDLREQTRDTAGAG